MPNLLPNWFLGNISMDGYEFISTVNSETLTKLLWVRWQDFADSGAISQLAVIYFEDVSGSSENTLVGSDSPVSLVNQLVNHAKVQLAIRCLLLLFVVVLQVIIKNRSVELNLLVVNLILVELQVLEMVVHSELRHFFVKVELISLLTKEVLLVFIKNEPIVWLVFIFSIQWNLHVQISAVNWYEWIRRILRKCSCLGRQPIIFGVTGINYKLSSESFNRFWGNFIGCLLTLLGSFCLALVIGPVKYIEDTPLFLRHTFLRWQIVPFLLLAFLWIRLMSSSLLNSLKSRPVRKHVSRVFKIKVALPVLGSEMRRPEWLLEAGGHSYLRSFVLALSDLQQGTRGLALRIDRLALVLRRELQAQVSWCVFLFVKLLVLAQNTGGTFKNLVVLVW